MYLSTKLTENFKKNQCNFSDYENPVDPMKHLAREQLSKLCQQNKICDGLQTLFDSGQLCNAN